MARKIYWTNSDNTISFADLNGTGGGQLNTTGATVSGNNDVAIDPAAGKIYWTNTGTNPNTIDFANLDGSGGGGQLNTGGARIGFPNGLAIDVAAGRIYWANGGDATLPVSYANLDGSGGRNLNAPSNGNGPFGLALDPTAGRVYYGEGNAIFYAHTDGSGGAQLNTGSAPLDGPNFPVLLKTPSDVGAPGLRRIGARLDTLLLERKLGDRPGRRVSLSGAANLCLQLDAGERTNIRCHVELDRRELPRAVRLRRHRDKPSRVELADQRPVHRECGADRVDHLARLRRQLQPGAVGDYQLQLRRGCGRAGPGLMR